MKLSKKWFSTDFADLSLISDDEFEARMIVFGHQPVRSVYNEDTLWDFEIPADRPDCQGVIGMAREVCAALDLPFKCHTPSIKGTDECSIFEMLDVDVWNYELCNRFTCKMAVNVNASSSPDWLKERLLKCGIIPTNNILDIAKYVMLEYGQPIQIMDSRCVSSGTIVIREAFPGESSLFNEALSEADTEVSVVADMMRPIVFGDAICNDAAIREDTTSVIIFAAHYCSSKQDPMLTHPAVERVCELIEQCGAGDIPDGTIDILNYVPHVRTIPFDLDYINNITGLSMTKQEAANCLIPLEIAVQEGQITLPSFRSDLKDIQAVAKEIKKCFQSKRAK